MIPLKNSTLIPGDLFKKNGFQCVRGFNQVHSALYSPKIVPFFFCCAFVPFFQNLAQLSACFSLKKVSVFSYACYAPERAHQLLMLRFREKSQ